MPHFRHRYLFEMLKKDLSWSPVVSVLGMRQVGKTTLLKDVGKTYLSLDDDEILRRFEQGEWGRLEQGDPPVIIDEAQKCPKVFDRVKLMVDRRKKPGQVLMTGSVRFLSKTHIRESLTGRTSIQELLPLTLAEAHERPLKDFVSEITKSNREGAEKYLEKIRVQKHFSRYEVLSYTSSGGMPGICFKRDEAIRERMREDHLETLLMRDLQFLVKTRIPYAKLKALLAALAQMQGQPVSLSDLGRKIQISTPTVIQVLRAFEALFLIRPHGKGWFLSDCGLAHFLGAGQSSNELFHMERFVFQEIYAQLNYLHKAHFHFEPYLTRGGVRIPFVVRVKNLPTIAIVVDATEGASEKSLKGLTWFAKGQKSPVISVVLHRGEKAYISSTSALCLPYEWVA